MKPYQAAILTVIAVIGLNELSSSAYNYYKENSKVKVGEVWQSRMSVLTFTNNIETGTAVQVSLRKVVKVDGDEITYTCQNDTTHYVEDIDTFTFNGPGCSSSKISEINKLK